MSYHYACQHRGKKQICSRGKTNNLAYRRIMLQKIRISFTFPSMVHVWFPQIKSCVNFNYLAMGLCMNLKCCFSDFHVGFLMKTGTNECAGNWVLWMFMYFFFLYYLSVKYLCAVCGIKAFIWALWALQNYQKKSIIKYLNGTFPCCSWFHFKGKVLSKIKIQSSACPHADRKSDNFITPLDSTLSIT